MRINSNPSSLSAQRFLSRTSKALSQALERLSSGKRINRAGDDAAGLAISTGLESQVRALKQSTRNLNDSLSYIRTAEGALGNQIEIVQRMRELAVQAASGTLGADDRDYLNSELKQLYQEFNRISEQTNFNGTSLLSDGLSNLGIQVGATSSEKITVNLPSVKSSEVFRTVKASENFSEGGETYETFEIDVNDVGVNLDGKYITVGLPGNDEFIFQFDLDANAVFPLPDNARSVVVYSGYSAEDVANELTLALGYLGFKAEVNGTKITVAAPSKGNLANATAGTSGFVVRTITEGEGTNLAMSAGSSLSSPVAVDLNGDNNIDLVSTNYIEGSVSIRLGNGDGTFSVGQTLSVGLIPTESAEVVDLNRDGKLDIVVANAGSSSVSIRMGNGDGTFSVGSTVTVGSGPFGKPKLTDINRDGKLDLLQSNSSGNSISVRLGVGDGTFTVGTTLSAAAGPSFSPEIYDLNADGNLDLLTSLISSGEISVRLGNGNGTFGAESRVVVGNSPRAAPLVVDINGDGRLDILQPNQDDNNISVRLGNGDGTFSVAATLTAGSYPMAQTVAADFNGDGRLDLVQSSGASNELTVYIGNGNGTFANPTYYAVGGDSTSSPQVVDFNDDGKLDILQASNSSSDISLFFGNGNGTFKFARTFFGGYASGSRPVVSDFNNDGVSDFAQSSFGALGIFLGGEEGAADESDIDISTQLNARKMLDTFDGALQMLTEARAKMGALENRLDYAGSITTLTQENLSLARSQILDSDVAEETANLTRAQILQQAGVSVLSQANLQNQTALKLLQNII